MDGDVESVSREELLPALVLWKVLTLALTQTQTPTPTLTLTVTLTL